MKYEYDREAALLDRSSLATPRSQTLRDLSEIMALSGIEISHETARDWEVKLWPIMSDALRKRRHGTRREAGISGYVGETYLRVRRRWCYLYRAIDRDGNLIDAMLSEQRDMQAAKAFFRSARAIMGIRPDLVTIDGHGSYPRAIRTVLGKTVQHRTSVYLSNRLEQDHCGIKGRIGYMSGYKRHDAAERFCRDHGELRNLLRPRRHHNQIVSASLRRARFAKATHIALDIMQNAQTLVRVTPNMRTLARHLTEPPCECPHCRFISSNWLSFMRNPDSVCIITHLRTPHYGSSTDWPLPGPCAIT